MNYSKSQKAPSFLIIIAIVIVFLYFELATNVWFLKLTGGYLIKVWVPPLLLLYCHFTKRIMRSESILSISHLNLILLSYSIFGLIAMLYSEPLYLAIKYYLVMISPIWLYFVITENIKDNRDIYLLLKILFYASFLLCIYTYYIQWRYAISPSEVAYDIVTSAGNVVSLSEASFGTSEAVISRGLNFYEAGKYSSMLAPSILYGIFLYFKSNKNNKYIYLAFSFIMLYQSLQALSRSSLFATSAGIVILLWYLYRYDKKIRSKIILFATFIILLGVTYVINNFHVILRFLALFNFLEIQGLNDHLDIYALGVSPSGVVEFDPHYVSIFGSIETFFQSPLLGSGYIVAEQYLREHNRYLFILVSSGLFALILYVYFIIRLTFNTGRATRYFGHFNPDRLNYGYLFYACNIMFLLKLLNEGMETFYYWIFFAFAMSWIRNCKREQSAIRRIV